MPLNEFLHRFRDPSTLTAPPALIEYLSRASAAYLTCNLTAPESYDDREQALLCHLEINKLLGIIYREVTLDSNS